MKGRKGIADISFLAIGLLIQVVTYFLMPHDSWLSLVSGCLGVCSVCMAAQRKIVTYLFGFGQVLTYTYLCWEQRFYGEVMINAYYFCTMIYGVYVWKSRMSDGTEGGVVPRSLSLRTLCLIVSVTFACAWLTGWGLASLTDDTQPYLDAFTTVPALVAQVLMILVYREHWFIWLAVDILRVLLWLRAGESVMAAQ